MIRYLVALVVGFPLATLSIFLHVASEVCWRVGTGLMEGGVEEDEHWTGFEIRVPDR